MERILAFGCHPDDIEFMAAGTIVLLAELGHEIHLATMTGGEVGHPTLSRKEIQAKRLKEAAESASIIGAQYHYAGGRDLEVEYNSEYRRMAVHVMRKVNPTIVLAPPPMDYLPDHEQTSLLVRNAAFIASVPLYDCGSDAKPMESIPHLYYWDAVGGSDIFGRSLPLHFGIDISQSIERKEKMLACHASQREWLAYINGWDEYLEIMKRSDKRQGELIGREFGECFVQHLGNGHPTDNILAELLKEHCVTISKINQERKDKWLRKK